MKFHVMSIRKWLKPFALVLTIAAGSASAQAPDLSRMDIVMKAVPDGPIAKVNDQSISREEFLNLYLTELQAQQQIRGAALSEPDRIKLGIQALGIVIEREVLRQEANKRNLNVSDAEVQEVWERTLEAARRSSAAGGGTVDEQEVLDAAGASKDEALNELREALLVEEARNAIAKEGGVNVSDSDVRERFNRDREKLRRPDQLHLKQIYLRVPPGQNDAANAEREKARERANTILKRLQQGQTFEALARQESDGPFKEKEGDLGPMPVNQLPPFLTTAAEGLEPGQISGVIESPVGFHIIKMVETIPGEDPSFDKVEKFLRNRIMEERSGSAVRDFVQEQMQAGNYTVETYLDLDSQLRYRPDLRDQLEVE